MKRTVINAVIFLLFYTNCIVGVSQTNYKLVGFSYLKKSTQGTWEITDTCALDYMKDIVSKTFDEDYNNLEYSAARYQNWKDGRIQYSEDKTKKYNANGQIIEESFTNRDNLNTRTSQIKTTYIYNDNNQVVKQIVDDQLHTNYCKQTNYAYEGDRLVGIYYYGNNDYSFLPKILVRKKAFAYNSSGFLIRYTEYIKADLIDTLKWLVKKYYNYGVNNELLDSTKIVKYYKHNIEFFDEEKYFHEYNAKGLLIKMDYWKNQKHLVEYKYHYNAKNLLDTITTVEPDVSVPLMRRYIYDFDTMDRIIQEIHQEQPAWSNFYVKRTYYNKIGKDSFQWSGYWGVGDTWHFRGSQSFSYYDNRNLKEVVAIDSIKYSPVWPMTQPGLYVTGKYKYNELGLLTEKRECRGNSYIFTNLERYYYDTISLVPKLPFEYRVFPNPTTSRFEINCIGKPNQQVRLKVLDLSGIVVWEKTESLESEKIVDYLPKELKNQVLLMQIIAADWNWSCKIMKEE